MERIVSSQMGKKHLYFGLNIEMTANTFRVKQVAESWKNVLRTHKWEGMDTFRSRSQCRVILELIASPWPEEDRDICDASIQRSPTATDTDKSWADRKGLEFTHQSEGQEQGMHQEHARETEATGHSEQRLWRCEQPALVLENKVLL